MLREFSDARLTLQRLTVALPNNAQAHYLLGLAYAGLNDLESLQAELEKSVKLAPDLVLARLALTKALLATGHSEQAAEQLAVLKEQAPENPGVIALEGSLLAGSGDEQRALATFEKLFETNPNTSNLVSVSRLQWRKGDKEKSIATIKQWIEKHPEDTSARLELANAYLGLQQKSEAIEQYEAILSLSESSWIAYNNLAWNLRHSDPKLALDYAEKAYEIAPTSNVVLDTLVALLLDQGELRRAGRLLLPGLERDPGNPSLVFHQAKLFEAEGNPDSARKVLEALVIDGQPLPNRPQVEEMLARLKGQK